MRRSSTSLAPLFLLAALTACGIPELADESKDLENPFPGPPTQISALGGSDSILLRWQPNITGAQAESFNVYDAAAPGMPLTNVPSASNMSYQVTNLSPGSYAYRIAGTNPLGVEGEPGAADATVSVTIPNTPAGVALNAAGEDTVTITWTAGTGSSTAVTAHYRIYKALASDGAMDGGIDTPDASLSFDYPGLAAGTRYRFEVAAVSTDGEISPPSTEGVQRSTWASPPGTVTVQGQAVDVEAIGWTPPAGQTVTAYQVTNLTSNVTLPDVAGTSTQETGLSAGTTYSYAVRSLNEDGIAGDASATVSAPTLADAPALAVDSVGDQQVELLWDAVPSATGYNIYRSDTQGIQGPLLTTVTPGTVTTFTDTAVSNGTDYYYVANTVNASGEGPGSTEVTAIPSAGALAPPVLNVDSAVDGQVVLSWTAVPGAAGYNIYRSDTQGVQGALLQNVTPGTVTTFTDATAFNGTTWYYVSTTVNSQIVEGDESAEVQATPTTTVTPPSAFTLLTLGDQATVHSGFLVGGVTVGTDANPIAEVSLDGGDFTPGIFPSVLASTLWQFQLPTGAQIWRQGTSHTITPRVRDAFGNVITLPTLTVKQGMNQDPDGDGVPDMVTGAPFPAATDEPGRVIANLSSGGGVIIDGEIDGDRFGSAVAMGDINGDGFADLVVGAPEAGGGLGGVYVFYATTTIGTGFSGTGAGAADHFIGGLAANGTFGAAVALGDLNGDGHADLVVGVPASAVNTVHAFHAVPGGGIPATASIATASTTLTSLPGEFFGNGLAVGDVTGDGFADIVVGAILANVVSGRVYAFHSAGVSGVPSADTAAANTVLAGTESLAGFGRKVAVGDLNNDGRADIAAANNTKVFVFHATAGGGVPSGNDTTARTTITEEVGGTASPVFGAGLAIGSINGTPFPALVIGDPQFSIAANSTHGRVYAFQSALDGSGLPVGTISAATADTIITGEGAGNHFGAAVGIADLTGDGFGDVVASAPLINGSTGRVYLFEAGEDGSGIADFDGTAANAATQVFSNGTAGSAFGTALAP